MTIESWGPASFEPRSRWIVVSANRGTRPPPKQERRPFPVLRTVRASTSLTFACLCLAASAAIGATAPPASAAPKLRSLGGGAWSWFGDPRGVHHSGLRNRTYIGWIDGQGDVKVASHDHTTRLRTTVVLRWGLEIDDHANPSLHVRPDGRLIVFYSRHGGSRMYYRTSTRPEDVTRWRRERALPTNTSGPSGYTYPNPIQLPAERNRLWLFWRGGSSQPSFSTSPDNGGTWSPARTLIRYPKHRPYIKFASNGRDTIHFAFTQGHPRNLNSNIYYARYRAGRFFGANGRRLGSRSSLPLAPADADKVYDSASPAWVHDIAVDRAGRPVVVFAAFKSESEHHYRYARFDGRAWHYRPITPAGGPIAAANAREPHYSGGITLDHENPSVVYLSREVGGVHEVETWRTPNGGTTWSRQAVTSRSPTENVRPISPRGLRSFASDMSVVWMRGRYDHWVTYRTDITTRLLSGGNLPPIAEASASPRSGGAPLRVQFDGRASRDPDGSALRFHWNFGDGTRGTGRAPAHTYRSRGRYFVTLTVTDPAGARDAFVNEVVVR